MKKIIISLLALFAVVSAQAADDYAKYYKNLPVAMSQPTLPTIPSLQVSLLNFGGKGDGLTLNTEAFSKAIAYLAKNGGGHLNVPAGIYLTGRISLKDNIDLHIEKNAIIVFSEDKNDFINVKKESEPGKRVRCLPALTASKRTNISITGEGTIDGNGEWWRPVKRVKVSDVEWKQYNSMGGTVSEAGDLWFPFNLKHELNIAATKEEQDKLRNHMVRLTDCKNVLIQGVTLLNSPNFHLVPSRCENVVIDGITVKCPWNAQNGDAIDVGNCKNVLIVNNVIDAGDDGICMKGGSGQSGLQDGPCENINIQDNTVYHAHGGFVIGSDCSGGMKNIVVRNNTFQGTDTGLRFKSAVKRGGKTDNIFIDHIYMTDIAGDAITFETTYFDNHVGAKKGKEPEVKDFLPDFQGIYMSDIYVRGCKNGIVAHGEEGMVHNISIKNSNIFYNDKATDIDKACKIQLENVKLETFAKK